MSRLKEYFNPQHVARILYWLSFFVLLGGAWLLIRPGGRRAGQCAQVYKGGGKWSTVCTM